MMGELLSKQKAAVAQLLARPFEQALQPYHGRCDVNQMSCICLQLLRFAGCTNYNTMCVAGSQVRQQMHHKQSKRETAQHTPSIFLLAAHAAARVLWSLPS
jgi:hypothetical protein